MLQTVSYCTEAKGAHLNVQWYVQSAVPAVVPQTSAVSATEMCWPPVQAGPHGILDTLISLSYQLDYSSVYTIVCNLLSSSKAFS